MAYIRYVPEGEIPEGDRVADTDNILRIHGANPTFMRRHYDLYRSLMYAPGPLTRTQREMLAVVVSGINGCHY